MTPFKCAFTPVLVLIYMHVVALECSRNCDEPKCSRIMCSSRCSCLGSLLDCSKRELVDIPNDLPVWVEILDMDNNKIVSIDDSSLNGLDNLTEINLSRNQLHIVNSTNFENLTSLQKLAMNHNQLVELPKFSKSLHLTHLSLQHNKIRSLSASILEDLPNLQNLDLSFNNLEDLPSNTFGNSTSLLHLSLSYNRIASLENGLFDNLASLESLKLSRNKLLSFPKEFFSQLNTLQYLEINSNSLTEIESLNFIGLHLLVALKLRHNSIWNLKDGAFYGLNSIRKLYLDYNNIQNVTKGWLYGLNSLKYLYINNNNITEIQDGAWDSKILIELDVSHNKLQTISSKSFDKLHFLKKLILSDNLISVIEEDSFRSLSQLHYLELKNNQVSWTMEDTGQIFTGLLKLKFLGLSNNKIKSVVKRAFSGLYSLEVLNMTHNDITTIEENAFDYLTHLQELYLNTSSLLCDCNLAWMPKNVLYKVHAKCGFPEGLKGMSVYEVSPTDMVCESSPKPVILKAPRNEITMTAENITLILECQARSNGNADIEFHWRKGGKLLNSSRHLTKNFVLRQGNDTFSISYLHIISIQEKDEGLYQCVASNTFGSVYSDRIALTVHAYPVFSKTPADVVVKPGDTARLECEANGRPRPEISWQKDGGIDDFPAARERRMHVMPSDHAFFIVQAKLKDTGVYSCTARNVAGTIVANATLTVLETPSFSKKMGKKEARVGETTILECLASGSLMPNLKWTKDGQKLYLTERHFFAANEQLLIIVETQGSDAGDYTCEMSNAVGTEKGTTNLKVLQLTASGLTVENPTSIEIIVIAMTICIICTSLMWVVLIKYMWKRFMKYSEDPSTNEQDMEQDQTGESAHVE